MKVALFVLAVTASLLLVGCAGARFTTKGGWSSPVVYESEEGRRVIYVGSQEGRLLALDSLGGLLWSFPDVTIDESPLGRVLYGAPAVDGERVYFGTYSGELYALDAQTGEMATEWSINPIVVDDGHIIGAPTLAGEEQCFGQTRGAVEGDVLVVGSSSGSVYAFCAADGSPVWRAETRGEVWGSPVVSDGTVYVGSQDGHMYAISLASGTPRWPQAFKAGGAIVAQPWVADGKVFFGALDGKVYALDAESGSPVWRKPFDGGNWFWAGVISDGEKLYAVTVKGKVVALDGDTGIKRWETNLNAMVISSPVLVQKQGGVRLMVATKEGEIAILRTEAGEEDGGRIPISNAENKQVKLKAPLVVSESMVYINTMDPWTTQVVDLNTGGNATWICPPSCDRIGQ
ncbi:MAG: PQQ-binding-like beta-propeller repeat protein [Chloroflexi bacterium]|nr:PQQ-binding-like beta-propeller repeat protein [Chloroflexota bacterium]